MVIGSRVDTKMRNGIQLKNRWQIKGNRQPITEINTMSTLYRCYNLSSWVCLITDRLISVLVLMRQRTTTKWPDIHLHEPKGKPWKCSWGGSSLATLGNPHVSRTFADSWIRTFSKRIWLLQGGLGASTVNEHVPAKRSFTGHWVCFYSLDNLHIIPTKPGNESVPGLVTKLPTC